MPKFLVIFLVTIFLTVFGAYWHKSYVTEWNAKGPKGRNADKKAEIEFYKNRIEQIEDNMEAE